MLEEFKLFAFWLWPADGCITENKLVEFSRTHLCGLRKEFT